MLRQTSLFPLLFSKEREVFMRWYERTMERTSRMDVRWVVGLRILLGLIILFKGIHFVQNTGELQNMLYSSKIPFGSVALAHYIALAHLTGGLFILIGAITRVAVIFNLPIILGAIFFINTNRGVYGGPYMITGELILSIFTLLLLMFFLFYGSGPYSVDNYVKYDVEREEHRFRERNILGRNLIPNDRRMVKGFAASDELPPRRGHLGDGNFWKTNFHSGL